MRHHPEPRKALHCGSAAPTPKIVPPSEQSALLRGLAVAAAGYLPERSGFLPVAARNQFGTLLLYCVKGGGWCEVGSRVCPIAKGDLLALGPGTPFSCGGHASRPWSVHWVHVRGDLLPEYLRELGVTPDMPVIHTGEEPQTARLFGEILRARQHGCSFADHLLASHALAYLLALLVQKRQAMPEDASNTVQRVAQAIIYLSEHLAEPLRVSVLARMASLSPTYFGELFKAQVGCAPRDYLHLLRMHRACQLLTTTTLSVKHIATSSGYQDPFHFSRQFKAFQGLTPSDYRARNYQAPDR